MKTTNSYDLILKGGQVVDPMQSISGKRDIGIRNGKIIAIEKSIPENNGRRVLPLSGKLVIPGLIDIHCHPSRYIMPHGGLIDQIGLDSGVSLLCDGGSAGASNFGAMRQFLVDRARTTTFCFINLATTGLAKMPEILSKHDIDLEWTRRIIEKNRDIIKGIKLRAVQPLAEALGIKAVEIAKKIATEFSLPFIMHIGEPRESIINEPMLDFTRAAVKLMEKGDILCHFMTREAGGLISLEGKIFPELVHAQDRGVLLDSSHGAYHFSFKVAKIALEQGLLPDLISTDIGSGNAPIVQSLPVTMSKFLNLGLSIEQVVAMTTANPARALGEEARYGSMKLGLPANLTVMELVEGKFIFSDGFGRNTLQGNMLLEPRMVMQNGIEVPCCSRYNIIPVSAMKLFHF